MRGCQFATLVDSPDIVSITSVKDWQGIDLSWFNTLQDRILHWESIKHFTVVGPKRTLPHQDRSHMVDFISSQLKDDCHCISTRPVGRTLDTPSAFLKIRQAGVASHTCATPRLAIYHASPSLDTHGAGIYPRGSEEPERPGRIHPAEGAW